MRLRTTSGGFVWQTSSDPVQALLYDFDVDSDQLKADHKRFLEQKVIAQVSAGSDRKWTITVEGRTSRSGAAGHNLALSRARAYAVYEYIINSAANAAIKPDWVGEVRAARDGEKDGKENMFYRAVEMVIRSEKQPPPPPVRHVPPKPSLPPHTKAFKIRVINGTSVSYGLPLPAPIPVVGKFITPSISRDQYVIEIWDLEENEHAFYRFEGEGQGLGAAPPKTDIKGFSATRTFSGGDWSDFHAPRYIATNDFGGPALLESAGASVVVDSYGPTRFSFRPLHWYSVSMGILVRNFAMGRTVGPPGVGFSTTQGELKYLGRTNPFR